MDKQFIEDLGDGLILRKATLEDAEAIADFNGKVHVDPGQDFVEHIYYWVKDLMNGEHPVVNASDFILVEDTKTGAVVSSLCLIDQTWSYDGIEFPVGRPELVGTLEAYRRRGLIRKQFDVVHQWSAVRGQMLQCITGIPWYYRQFGYEMAVNLDGGRRAFPANIPALKKDEEEKYFFREAEEKDLPFMSALYDAGSKRGPIACVRDEAIWRYDMFTRNKKSTTVRRFQIMETAEKQPVGFVAVSPKLWGTNLSVSVFEIVPGLPWLDAAHALLRNLEKVGQEYVERDSTEEKKQEVKTYSFNFGDDHPLYHVIPNRLPQKRNDYAFYVRVPDVAGFVRQVAPALEARLADSYMCGYSGEFKLTFYTDGLQMAFENGKITKVARWEKPVVDEASANFPNLTFLQLLLGHRTLDEIKHSYPDQYCRKG